MAPPRPRSTRSTGGSQRSTCALLLTKPCERADVTCQANATKTERTRWEQTMLSRLLIPFAVALGLAPVVADAAERPVVVELFTSQGCSCCPPANAYLNELSHDRRDVLPLAFHVTYWDRPGWNDPFSLEAATDRQDVYGHRFGDG